MPEVDGSIFYNHKALASNSALAAVLKARYAGGGTAVQPAAAAPSVPLRVGRPEADITTSCPTTISAEPQTPGCRC